jgi:hypothetical protein
MAGQMKFSHRKFAQKSSLGLLGAGFLARLEKAAAQKRSCRQDHYSSGLADEQERSGRLVSAARDSRGESTMAINADAAKNFIGAVREAIIVAVLLLFLLVPGMMNRVLARAGITKASIAGFEWQLQDSAQKTQDAVQNAEKLEAQLHDLGSRLDQLSASAAATPQVRDQITALSKDVERTRSDAKSVHGSLQSSLAVQRSIIQQVSPQVLERMKARPAPQ